jgi:hypothetical protein
MLLARCPKRTLILCERRSAPTDSADELKEDVRWVDGKDFVSSAVIATSIDVRLHLVVRLEIKYLAR